MGSSSAWTFQGMPEMNPEGCIEWVEDPLCERRKQHTARLRERGWFDFEAPTG
jgi:hypothetical protein